MSAATVALDIYQGDDWELTVEARHDDGTPYDLSSATITAQLRAFPASPDVVASCGVDMTSAAAGDVTLSLARSVTVLLPERCVWDFQVEKDGRRSTWLAGPVVATREVTR